MVLTVSAGLNINATRYFYWKTPEHTVLTRVKWARRRHLTQWVFFTNILFLWTSEYSFYRRHGSYIRTTNFFQHNYTSFNFITLKYVALRAVKNSELFVAASWYPRLQNFYTNRKFLHGKGHFYQYFTHSIVSTPSLSPKLLVGNTTVDLDTPWVNQNMPVGSLATQVPSTNLLRSVLNSLFTSKALHYYLTYYKVLVYLFIQKLLASAS